MYPSRTTSFHWASDLKSDSPGQLTFFGSDTADLFTREVNESFKGALALDYVSKPDDKFPLGFRSEVRLSRPAYVLRFRYGGSLHSRSERILQRSARPGLCIQAGRQVSTGLQI